MPAPGRIEKISASVTAPVRSIHTKCRHGAPYTNSIPISIAASTSAVPKSGSRKTSSAGRPM